MTKPDSPAPDHLVGYVCKVYPRFSETFIVSEVLAREAAGEHIHIVSLNRPREGRFHGLLSEVRADVTYLEDRAVPDARRLWEFMQAARGLMPVGTRLDRLLDEPVREGAQALELALLCVERGITHLHAHFATVATTIARQAAHLSGITYSFTAHAKDIFHEAVDAEDLRSKLRDADHVVTVTDYNRRYLVDRFGADAAKVQRVYNGLALDHFTYAGPASRPVVDVVAVGRLVEKKGFDVLVDACALARDRGIPLRCRIIGTGDQEASLRARIAAAGLEDLVVLVGPLPLERVPDELAGAAVMAAPCVVGADGNADGLPTVILEAMAVGVPVVSTHVTGIPEAIVHGRTGLLVPPGDAPALADAILQLRADADGRTRLARAARAWVEDHFTGRRQARELRGLLPSGHPRIGRSDEPIAA